MSQSKNAPSGEANRRLNHLEKLPHELRTLILYELGSTTAVYPLIRASPCYYHSFLQSRAKLVTKLEPLQFQPEVLPHAILAARALYLKPRIRMHRVTEPFMRQIRRDQVEHQPLSSLPLTAHGTLYQLHESVEWMVQEYFGRMIRRVAAIKEASRLDGMPDDDEEDAPPQWIQASESPEPLVSSEPPGSSGWPGSPESLLPETPQPRQPPQPLSTIEAGRLRRAFYRLQLYGSLFPTELLQKARSKVGRDDSGRISRTKRIRHAEVPLQKQLKVFLGNAPPWEVEELWCAHYFLRTRLMDIFDLLEDYYVQIGREKQRRDDDDDAEGGDGAAESETRDLERHFFAADSKKQHERYADHLISLGLPFLRRVFEANQQERMRLILHNYADDVPSLSDVLAAFAQQRNPHYRDLASYRRLLRHGEGLRVPSEAFVWGFYQRTHIDPLERGMVNLMNEDGLDAYDVPFIDWGYAIWDNSRMQDAGAINLPQVPPSLHHPPSAAPVGSPY